MKKFIKDFIKDYIAIIIYSAIFYFFIFHQVSSIEDDLSIALSFISGIISCCFSLIIKKLDDLLKK